MAWCCPHVGEKKNYSTLQDVMDKYDLGHIIKSEEFCEILRAKERSSLKVLCCKHFQKRHGRCVRTAAKNEICILKMYCVCVCVSGADVQSSKGGATEFKYPSYVQHIMGDIFSLGFGPFRWVCTSGDPADLQQTDDIAAALLEELCTAAPERIKQQYRDNILWIRQAGTHKMVVGSQARILYSNQKGRVAIAVAINKAIASGRVSAPVVISRDHHDVSGTDSPFRETSNVYDGSAFCADMAVQNFAGDAFRGATWVSLHNGGGVGWGEVMNGGFGLLLDGTEEAERRATLMLNWDVSNGVARRCWSGNSNAYDTIERTMAEQPDLQVTMPYPVQDEHLLDRALQG
ncbi:urocanate hydratase-like [Engraulis encrasicolus]|uniref:urocanate hydratase-like n=1 Tax=Engraulis encrasicolus TaxID=184585 RepID=UPI002FD751DD